MDKNQAIAITGIEEAKIIDVEMPEIGPYDVLVHFRACALCTMEQRIYRGTKNVGDFPVIAGHEGSGEIVKIGEKVKNCKVGDHVVSTDPYCGTCYYCRNGLSSQCASGIEDGVYKRDDGMTNMIGYLQKYVVVNYQRVIVISKELPFEYAALTEPLACCLHSINKANIKFADTVVVIGAGIMGLLHTQLAKKRGAVVVVSELDEERRNKAIDCGADFAVNPNEIDLVEFIKSKTDGLGANVVINTTPVHESWKLAMDMLAPMGKLLAYSSQHPDIPIELKMGYVHGTEIQIIGTQSSSEEDMYTSSKLIEKGLIDVSKVISYVMPFEKGPEAFAQSIVPGTYRVVITN